MQTDTLIILIVDDDSSLREFLEIFLAKEGYKVDSSVSGEEAIEKVTIPEVAEMIKKLAAELSSKVKAD